MPNNQHLYYNHDLGLFRVQDILNRMKQKKISIARIFRFLVYQSMVCQYMLPGVPHNVHVRYLTRFAKPKSV
jgi:hypothetical protein